jgi:hypothetical protein
LAEGLRLCDSDSYRKKQSWFFCGGDVYGLFFGDDVGCFWFGWVRAFICE